MKMNTQIRKKTKQDLVDTNSLSEEPRVVGMYVPVWIWIFVWYGYPPFVAVI
jgi:hypothetical protein